VRRAGLLLLGLLGATSGCRTLAHAVNVNGTNVGDAMDAADKDLTPENEYYVGRSVATNILAKADYKYLDKESIQSGKLEGLTAYVNRVGNLLAMSALETHRDGDREAPIAGWHFIVVDSPQINAWAAPGGYIFVTNKTIMTAKSEDELACVLAHEVAHVVRGHALGSIKKSRFAGIGKNLLKSSVQIEGPGLDKLKQAFDGAMDDMMDALLVKGYDRDTEYEADRVGVEIAARAGYDPSAMTRFLTTLKAQQKTGSGGFFATHPKAEDRIAKLADPIKKAGGARPVAKVRTDRFVAAQAAIQ
jgi:predicted Zn-dependent protease